MRLVLRIAEGLISIWDMDDRGFGKGRKWVRGESMSVSPRQRQEKQRVRGRRTSKRVQSKKAITNGFGLKIIAGPKEKN